MSKLHPATAAVRTPDINRQGIVALAALLFVDGCLVGGNIEVQAQSKGLALLKSPSLDVRRYSPKKGGTFRTTPRATTAHGTRILEATEPASGIASVDWIYCAD